MNTNDPNEVLVGKAPNGAYMTISVRLERRDVGDRFMTIDHEPAGSYVDVGIQGTMYPKGWRSGRDEIAGGQISGMLGMITEPEDGINPNRIGELWERWHLNGMRAGCAHQPDMVKRAHDAGISPLDQSGWMLDNAPRCPETGYKWGSAWLVEYVPEDVLRELEAIGRTKVSDEAVRN